MPPGTVSHGERTVLEACVICGKEVPFSVTTHVMLNPSGEEGVLDDYVCADCYDEHLEPLFGEASEE